MPELKTWYSNQGPGEKNALDSAARVYQAAKDMKGKEKAVERFSKEYEGLRGVIMSDCIEAELKAALRTYEEFYCAIAGHLGYKTWVIKS